MVEGPDGPRREGARTGQAPTPSRAWLVPGLPPAGLTAAASVRRVRRTLTAEV